MRLASPIVHRTGLVGSFPEASAGGGRDRSGSSGDQSPARDGAGIREELAVEICDGVIDILVALFGVSGRELRSSGRCGKPVARVRQVGMYVSHVALGLTMTQVGRGFGRDRSTVMHACHLVEDMRDDGEFDHIVATVERIAAVAFARYGIIAR